MKATILDALGERALLLPARIGLALKANDRVKYLLSLLQAAREHAEAPDVEPPSSLRAERMACGVNDSRLDGVPLASGRDPSTGLYRIPLARTLSAMALTSVCEMLDPLDGVEAHAALGDRLTAIEASLADLDDERMSARQLAALTSADPRTGDSLHLVVMDAHRALNRLQASLATETVEGARAHAIDPADRPLIRAFMEGVRRTERLRFDHPGLATTATRADEALVLQNDIGLTDAHVLVVRVSGLKVTISYTDVHLPRLLFFEGMLDGWGVRWEDARTRRHGNVEGGVFHATLGTLELDSKEDLAPVLEHLGSRLVFLIDWNRARKRLRRLVGDRDAIALLTWAAAADLGHMGFLRLGAERLVYEALDRVARGSVRAGETLRAIVGREAAVAYLRTVLGLCARGLLEGQPGALIADEVATELLRVMRTAHTDELAPVGAHAALIVEIASGVRDALLRVHLGDAAERRAAAAARAKRWESRADEILNDAREAVRRSGEFRACRDILSLADDVADDLEEAAFHLNLLPDLQLENEVERALQSLSSLVLQASRRYLSAVETARHLTPASSAHEVGDFLEAVHRVLALEHESDAAERRVSEAAFAAFEDARRLYVVTQAAADLERAADGLLRSGLAVREHVLAAILPGDPTSPLVERPSQLTWEGPRSATPAADEPPVFAIVAGHARDEGDALSMGAKAHGLARLALAGLPVPDAIVLGTRWSLDYAAAHSLPPGFRSRLAAWIRPLERAADMTFGGERRPLLLAVRSGAPVSMPGMLDTVLNVGLNDASARGLLCLTGNPRLVWSSYWRFVRSLAEVVHGCPPAPFEALLRQRLEERGCAGLRDLDAADLEDLARRGVTLFAELAGRPFPQDPMDQLELAVEAVFRSSGGDRARAYARLQGLRDDLGTGVTLQRMVFGNAGGASGAGVGFTRDPSTGENRLSLDFLFDAQGEDVVSGRYRIPEEDELGSVAPPVLREIQAMRRTLEREFGDVQEFEITVEDGRLFLLQTRTAKRTPRAALRIAVDQVREGVITPDVALERLSGLDHEALRVERVVGAEPGSRLGVATPASVGVAQGEVAVDAAHAQEVAAAGRAAILVREDIATEDVTGIAASEGVLTAAGGRTSHAAVVARELGKVCLVGCPDLRVDVDGRRCFIGEREIAEGDLLCLDGNTGAVYAEGVRVAVDAPVAELAELARWRAEIRGGVPAGGAGGVKRRGS